MFNRSTYRPSSRHPLQRAERWLAVVLFAGVITGSALAQNQEHAHETIAVIGQDYSFAGPSQIAPGWHYITFKNEGKEVHHLQFGRLNDGVSTDDFFAALKSEGEAALRFVALTGGVAETAPGTSNETLVDFTQPGTYVELCFVPNAEGVPHLALGMTSVVQVSGTLDSVEVPTPDVVVHMYDFGYKMPASITPGLHVWEVINDGPEPHEMNVLKLNDGVTFDDFMTGLAAGDDDSPMPGVLMGGAQGLNNGLVSYIDYDLDPGTYVALCFIPDPATGKPHIALGMVTSFTVASAQN